jgi:hypothetical protein
MISEFIGIVGGCRQTPAPNQDPIQNVLNRRDGTSFCVTGATLGAGEKWFWLAFSGVIPVANRYVPGITRIFEIVAALREASTPVTNSLP